MLDPEQEVVTLTFVTRTATTGMRGAWYALTAIPSRLRPAVQPFAETQRKQARTESGHAANLDSCLA